MSYQTKLKQISNSVLTGELKSKVDSVWEAFWTGGISNPIEVLEQLTYLLFIKRLDDLQSLEEKEGFNEVGMGRFFRKGKVGEWKEKLDPKLVKKIEDHFRKEMMELNYL